MPEGNDGNSNVDTVKAEHIDRQKRTMDDHKRLDEFCEKLFVPFGSQDIAIWILRCRNQLERKLGMSS